MVNRFAVLFCCAVLARAEVNTPRLGWVHYPDGHIRSVMGLPGAFVLGEPLLDGITSASFSKEGGILAGASGLTLTTADGSVEGAYETSDSKPVLNIGDEPLSAIAWMPSTHQIVYQSDHGSFTAVSVDDALAGDITSIERRGAQAVLLSETGKMMSELVVSLATGQVISAQIIPGLEAPSYRCGNFVVTGAEHDIRVTNASGISTAFAISGKGLRAESIGDGWAHLWSGSSGRHWAVHVRNGEPVLFELPGGGSR
jgi:hypothetical protein